MRFSVGSLVAATFLSACAHGQQHWDKPGWTQHELDANSYECERDARVVTQPGRLIGSASAEVDDEFFNKCMVARGWVLTDVASEPTRNDGAAEHSILTEEQRPQTQPEPSTTRSYPKGVAVLAPGEGERAPAWGMTVTQVHWLYPNGSRRADKDGNPAYLVAARTPAATSGLAFFSFDASGLSRIWLFFARDGTDVQPSKGEVSYPTAEEARGLYERARTELEKLFGPATEVGADTVWHRPSSTVVTLSLEDGSSLSPSRPGEARVRLEFAPGFAKPTDKDAAPSAP